MEILGKERIASLSTHYTLCTYACLDLDATQVREKNRRVKKDGKGTRKGITYQQEFLAKKKGESKEIRLQRIGYMRGKTWDGREANNAFR